MQSTALLVLAAQRKIDFQTFLFCNVGDDSEAAHTLAYVRQVATPWAAEHGIVVHELRRTMRDGRQPSLLSSVRSDANKSLTIPVRSGDTGALMSRNCTSDWKVRVTIKWLRQQGATRAEPGLTALGISLDELHRARAASKEPIQTICYPLIEMRLDRHDCRRIILDAGLPLPKKSSCWFCPFHANGEWQRLRTEEPDLFAQAVDLEDTLNRKAARIGHGNSVFFHNRRVPLMMATTANIQGKLFDDSSPLEVCESGYCMT